MACMPVQELIRGLVTLIAVLMGGAISIASSYFAANRQDRRKILMDRREQQLKAMEEVLSMIGEMGKGGDGAAMLSFTPAIARLLAHLEVAFGNEELGRNIADVLGEIAQSAKAGTDWLDSTHSKLQACDALMHDAVRATERALGVPPFPKTTLKLPNAP